MTLLCTKTKTMQCGRRWAMQIDAMIAAEIGLWWRAGTGRPRPAPRGSAPEMRSGGGRISASYPHRFFAATRQSVCGRRRGQIVLSTCDSSAQMDLSKHTLTQGMTRSAAPLPTHFPYYRIHKKNLKLLYKYFDSKNGFRELLQSCLVF